MPYFLSGAAAFFQRAEVRDLLAWLRLLENPGDAGAVVRALARPPVELRAIDLARVTQIARRRKLDMVAALSAALESPQIPPEARERIVIFLKLYRSAAGALDSSRPDLYVHRLIERLGLRRQLLFAATTEVVERLRNLARFAELAAAYVRRAPQATAREFARSIAAVADAGLREEEAAGAESARGVRVMTMHDAKGHEFEHVYVLGLMSARMPGPRRQTLEPIADALLKEAVPPASRSAHAGGDAAAAARGDDARAGAARARLSRAHRPRRGAAAVAVRGGGAAAVGGEWEPREEELFGPAETLQSTFRLLRDELHDDGRAGRRAAGRAALRHRPGRLARRRALPRAAQALGAAGADAQRRAVGRGGAARGQRAAAAGGDVRAARDLRDLGAGRVPARRRARRADAGAGRGRAQRAVAGDVPAAPRRRAAAERDRHRDLPDVPAEVQVRARLPDPERADDQPALRHPRPPGAGALPRGVVRGPARAARACWRPAGGAAGSGTPRRSASSAPRRRRRWSATTTASRRRTASRSGSSAGSSSGSARTCCAGAWTASTGCRTAATS